MTLQNPSEIILILCLLLFKIEVVMNTNRETPFETLLNQQDSETWSRVITALLPSIHDVDKTATQIWFKFFPLDLARALQQAEDPVQLARDLLLQGKYQLKDQIDSSHRFLYGHRFWPEVKNAVAAYASSVKPSTDLDLKALISELAGSVAKKMKVEDSLLIGITAVALMTLQQVGLNAFKSAPGVIYINPKFFKKSPEQILKARARDDWQGLFGFLRGIKKEWTVTFDENDETAKFKLIHTQELTTAAMYDKRDHSWRDPRCMKEEGPIPVQCRSAACGTCWVGILGGAEKLSEVSPLEGRKIKEFGYIDTNEPKPLIRLACMAQAFGAVSIVIPPWNGVFGKFLRARNFS
jgi:ferredoxin